MKKLETTRRQIGWYPEEDVYIEELRRAYGGELPQWLLDKIKESEGLPCPDCRDKGTENYDTIEEKLSNLKEMCEDGKVRYLAGEPMYFDFPAVRVPVECEHCRGEGKTVADNLRGLDFSVEELRRDGDWDDYVSHEGIWQWHKCSRCSGHGCYMDVQIDEAKVLADYPTEWKMYMDELEDKSQHQAEMELHASICANGGSW